MSVSTHRHGAVRERDGPRVAPVRRPLPSQPWFQTLVAGLALFAALPTIAVGLIEESCKLVLSLLILTLTRHRREIDGVLFGVASGMGFAAFETMGYGLQALLASGGDIGEVEKLLFIRGLLAPAGHAAWTGLICAMLWRAWARPTAGRILAVIAAFLGAVTLHGLPPR